MAEGVPAKTVLSNIEQGAKDITKGVVWGSLHKLALLLFKMSDNELNQFVMQHPDQLCKAELTLLEHADDPRIIWAFIERVIGKAEPQQSQEKTSNVITHDDILAKILELKNGRAKPNSIAIEQKVEDGTPLQDS